MLPIEKCISSPVEKIVDIQSHDSLKKLHFPTCQALRAYLMNLGSSLFIYHKRQFNETTCKLGPAPRPLWAAAMSFPQFPMNGR